MGTRSHISKWRLSHWRRDSRPEESRSRLAVTRPEEARFVRLESSCSGSQSRSGREVSGTNGNGQTIRDFLDAAADADGDAAAFDCAGPLGF